MDPLPRPNAAGLILACLPAVFAASFAAASAAMAAFSPARRAALRDILDGGSKAALERYLESGVSIESRWLVVRALGMSLSAILWVEQLPMHWGALRLVGATFCVVLAYAVPSEIGRALVSRDPERAGPLLLKILYPIELLAAPISAPILWLSQSIGGWLSSPPSQTPGVTETEVEMIVTEGELNGSLAHEQSEMIRNVLEFGDVTAGQVMVPRTQVTALSIDTPLDEALQRIAESGHSRYPVYRGSVDNVVGLLYAKDLLRHAADSDSAEQTLEGLVRTPVAFVPDSQSASSVLKDMRAGRHHLAVVIDEFGGMNGILTLEDLLEKIVGDIRDEHDVEEPPIVDLGNGRLVADASVPIADLSRYLGANLPSDGDYHSLGGFMIAQLGRVPEVGARLAAFGLEFEVREGDERRVSKIEITRLSPPESVVPRS
ncbi:MAG TPA: hemolysin family protein, partial [Polyangiaceae bacterium]|nr:hemolysin family protein [Polyangiaceae bacterium]